MRLGSRAFDILVALIERAGQTISKEELHRPGLARHGRRRGRPQGPCRGAAQSARRWPCRQALHRQPCRARLRLYRTGDARERAFGNRRAGRGGRGREFAGAAHARCRPRRDHSRAHDTACSAPLYDDRRVQAGSARRQWPSRSRTARVRHTRPAYGSSGWPPCPIPISCRVRLAPRWGSILQAATTRGRWPRGCATRPRCSCSTAASTSLARRRR